MNLHETLKQFKQIEPNARYAATSKRAILATTPGGMPVHGWNAQRTIWKIIESGAAVALTGFFILLIMGAFNGAPFVPQYTAIDTQALRAEAQAIDMQIQLANLNYANPIAESTMQMAGAPKAAVRVLSSAESTALVAPTGTPSSTDAVSIDQALQSLTK